MVDKATKQEILKYHKKCVESEVIGWILNIPFEEVEKVIKRSDVGDFPPYEVVEEQLLQGDCDFMLSAYKATGYDYDEMTELVNYYPEKFGLDKSFITCISDLRYFLNLAREQKEKDEAAKAKAKAKKRAKAKPPINYEMGDVLQVSVTEAPFKFADEECEYLIYVYAFVYPWSHKTFFWASPYLNEASWLYATTQCLKKYGIPKKIACLKNDSIIRVGANKEDLSFSPSFKWFCEQYNIECEPFRPKGTQRLGAVDQACNFVKTNGLVWLKVTDKVNCDFLELNNALEAWNTQYSDTNRFFTSTIDGKTDKYTPKQLFEVESQVLGKMDPNVDSSIYVCYQNVSPDGYVFLNDLKIKVDDKYKGYLVSLYLAANGSYILLDYDNEVIEHEKPANSALAAKEWIDEVFKRDSLASFLVSP